MVLASGVPAALLAIMNDLAAFMQGSRSQLHSPMVDAHAALLTELEHDPIRLLAHES